MVRSSYFWLMTVGSLMIVQRPIFGVMFKKAIKLLSAPGQGNDMKSTLPLLGTFFNTPATECAIRCMVNPGCGGINFFNGIGELRGCELINGKTLYSIVDATGYQYFDNANFNYCYSSPCPDGATCVNGVLGYTCECMLGYTGTRCEINIDDCQQNGCIHGSTCIDGINNYTCRCLPGYSGQYCDVCPIMRMGPNCDQDCKLTVKGFEFNGTISKTKNGKTCQRWDSLYPHVHIFGFASNFPDATVADAANYCRNPVASDEIAPWCYTTSFFVRWEYCTVPLCK